MKATTQNTNITRSMKTVLVHSLVVFLLLSSTSKTQVQARSHHAVARGLAHPSRCPARLAKTTKTVTVTSTRGGVSLTESATASINAKYHSTRIVTQVVTKVRTRTRTTTLPSVQVHTISNPIDGVHEGIDEADVVPKATPAPPQVSKNEGLNEPIEEASSNDRPANNNVIGASPSRHAAALSADRQDNMEESRSGSHARPSRVPRPSEDAHGEAHAPEMSSSSKEPQVAPSQPPVVVSLQSAAGQSPSHVPAPNHSPDPAVEATRPLPAGPESAAASASASASSSSSGSFSSSGSSTSSGSMETCEISVYTYAPASECTKIYDTSGSCGLSMYFADVVGSTLPRLAVPMGIFDRYGASQANTLCGKTVTIKAANGAVGKAIIADRNQGTSFDLCMDLWTDFGYTDGGGRFAAQYTFD